MISDEFLILKIEYEKEKEKEERRLNRTLNIENQTNSFLKITKSPIRFATIKVRMKERANSEKKRTSTSSLQNQYWSWRLEYYNFLFSSW